ncbi:MAG: peptidase dimerization domain-containing protein, partial [Nitrospinota bacterium]|nr:peptidase dimerization domain-containing protein [Nitrospinota bacterium]
KEEARVHGIFIHGGDAPNIIPEKVVMHFYIRALDREYFKEVIVKVRQCAQGAAKSAGCRVAVKQRGYSYDPFYPSRPMGRAFLDNLSLVGMKDDGFTETEEIGSSDIGNLSQVVPTLHPEYAVGGRDDINHSRKFLDAVMSKKGAQMALAMTKAMAMTVYDLLTDPALMAETKQAFKAGK